MKKKILAVLLTLCLVLGLLPLSAMADTWKLTFDGQEYTLRGNDQDGYKILEDGDNLKYYTFFRGTGPNSDKFMYYTLDKTQFPELTGQYPVDGAKNSTGVNGEFQGYDITLDPNGGTVEGSSEPIIVTTDKNGLISGLPTPTRAGYAFVSWYDALTGGHDVVNATTGEVDVNDGDMTLYARWTENDSSVTVTFHWNDGTGKTEGVKTNENKTVTWPDDPTRDGGYVFLGWYDKLEGGEKITADKKYDTATDVYAYWGFEITFDVNYEPDEPDESFEKTCTAITDEKGVLSESDLPSDPERDGNKFVGWYDAPKDGKEVDITAAFKNPTTVYAYWEPTVEIVVEVTPDETGAAEADVEFENGTTAQDWIDKTNAELDSDEPPTSITVKVAAPVDSQVKSVKVKIPAEILDAFGEVALPVYVETPRGRFNIPHSNVTALAEQLEDVELDIGSEDESDVPAPPTATTSGRTKREFTAQHIVDVSLKSNDVAVATEGSELAELVKGIVVYINTTLQGYGADNVKGAVWYKGSSLVRQTGDGYDPANKQMYWAVDHFSEYVFGTETTTTTGGGGNGTGGGGGGGGGSASSGYSVSVSRTTNGTVSVSPSRAEEGDTVTITVRPNEGYELDTLTVKDADGNTIRTTKTSDGKYTFTMPDGKVTIEATFKAIEEDTAPAPATPSFSDVPSSFWAYEQITWVAEQGIMNGYANGTFGADNNTTRQALWMVLGRLSGELNADSTMAQAREWAIANNVSDGTNPGNAMSRQQMVTMLYRYAQMKGYATNGSTDLSTYPDAAGVASYAQDALSWAVANGVVTGTTDGRLNPEGTASRAHFAVFMYRFCGLYADEA